MSNVFVTRKAVDRYANAARRLGARVMVLRMDNDFGNVHNVPTNALLSMKNSFEDYPGEQHKSNSISHTKKQIEEAIAYWQRRLDEIENNSILITD